MYLQDVTRRMGNEIFRLGACSADRGVVHGLQSIQVLLALRKRTGSHMKSDLSARYLNLIEGRDIDHRGHRSGTSCYTSFRSQVVQEPFLPGEWSDLRDKYSCIAFLEGVPTEWPDRYRTISVHRLIPKEHLLTDIGQGQSGAPHRRTDIRETIHAPIWI